MEVYFEKELSEKKQYNLNRKEIEERFFHDEIDNTVEEAKATDRYLEDYYGNKKEFLSEIEQRAKELHKDLSKETQEETKITQESIKTNTMGISKSEIDFVINQIKSLQSEKSKNINGR